VKPGKRRWRLILTACAAIIAGFVLLPFVAPPLLRWRTIEEHLTNPRTVRDWSSEGLRLEDGQTVALPGISSLPAKSAILSELVRQGVELTPDGRVMGLVRIWHWCGNDPVRRHTARVDIAHVLLYFGDMPVSPDAEYVRSRAAPRTFSDSGWNVSDYGRFMAFTNALEIDGE
jgi:hypothetical protein